MSLEAISTITSAYHLGQSRRETNCRYKAALIENLRDRFGCSSTLCDTVQHPTGEESQEEGFGY